MECEILLPPDHNLTREGEIAKCVLQRPHYDGHLCPTSKGGWILWTCPREPCGCEVEDCIDCFDYRNLTEKEAQDMIRKDKEGSSE